MRSMLTSKGEDPGDEDLSATASPSPASPGTPPASSARCSVLDGVRTDRPRHQPEATPASDATAADSTPHEHERTARGHRRRDAGRVRPATTHVADVEEALRDVVDPELGINVVDLGLVYGITVDAQHHAVIDMTLTVGGLPADRRHRGPDRQALEGLVATYRINWVWMPPWGPDKITDDGREQLRALGFNI